MHRMTLINRVVVVLLTMMLAFGTLPALAQDSTPVATPSATESITPPATPTEVVVPPADEGTPPLEEATPPVEEVATPPLVGPSTPGASPAASPVADLAGTVDLDVLFIGAHPDDEAWALSTYGQWNELHDVQVGVITITRGEGGGNAVGTEEGPALGLLREDEERRAVGVAGIEHVYNLDEVDFYYTVSAELTADTWGYDETLEKVVRVVRATQPEVIVTMSPAPTPGNHGHHQMAARLAVDAYYTAAEADAFPAQISDEDLDAWRVSRIFRSAFAGESQPGPMCAETLAPTDPTDVAFGVWAGTESEIHGDTWANLERQGQRQYASQGWAGFPDAPEDPNEIACDVFTLIDSRTPFDTENFSTTAAIEGAVLQAEGGLPLGTELYITTDTFHVTPGQPFEATVHAGLIDGSADAEVELTAPEGWEVGEATEGEMSWTYTVTPGADAAVDERALLSATLTSGGASGMTVEPVDVTAAVTGSLEALPEVAYFREWVEQVDVPQLDSLIFPVFSMGVGETREITVNVENRSDETASGTVELALPAGFDAESTSAEVADLAGGESATVTFTVTNTDKTLGTSNEAGETGHYAFTITTSTDSGSSVQDAGINLVPATTVPYAESAPSVDGTIAEGEYTGEALDLGRVWEGQPVDSEADGSGTAYVTYDDAGVYIAVEVTDDTLGTVLPASDAKRHWRTDSVEIAIDPLGTASNTSATFKVGVFPTTEEGEPAAYRDADAFQGPIEETAPGMEVASTVNEPFDGYVIEVMIPHDALPAEIDPENAAMNIFIYDSDTQDLTGQTRLGWSTWGGVQGDPYRWGTTTFEAPGGAATPAAARVVSPTVDDPVMPLEAAQSIHSPQSIRQSANDGVGLGGNPVIPDGEGVTIDNVTVADGVPVIELSTASAGDLYIVHVVDGAVVAEETVTLGAGETYAYTLTASGGGEVLISFQDEQGRVQAIAEAFGP
jgi:LmbE family N-acetylglucosaminyl deacetylase